MRSGRNHHVMTAILWCTAVLGASAALAMVFSPSPGHARGLRTNDVLGECRRILSVSIKYSWVESASSRLFSKHHYVFLDGQYEGYAHAAIKSDDQQEVQKLEDLIVPVDVIEAFFKVLRDSPIEKVENIPGAAMVEGVPYYEISIELCDDEVKFFTVPGEEGEEDSWVASIAGKGYKVTSGIPKDAVKVLKPFMHFDIIEQWKDGAFGKKNKKKVSYKLKKAPPPFKNVYFDVADYSIRKKYEPALFQIALYLREHKDVEVLVAGHCDERGSEDYNFALGEKRAYSVISFLINFHVDPARVNSVSYGENRPVDEGFGEDAWQKNRRAEFFLYDWKYEYVNPWE